MTLTSYKWWDNVEQKSSSSRIFSIWLHWIWQYIFHFTSCLQKLIRYSKFSSSCIKSETRWISWISWGSFKWPSPLRLGSKLNYIKPTQPESTRRHPQSPSSVKAKIFPGVDAWKQIKQNCLFLENYNSHYCPGSNVTKAIIEHNTKK